MNSRRSLHVVAAVLLTATAATTFSASAAPGDISSFVPIVPCRLADTRPATAVGSRTTPLGPAAEVTFAIWGTNGNCTIPSTATAVAFNVTAINPTSPSYLTVFPSHVTRPLTANLNWDVTSPPTPNLVTVATSPTGAVKIFNQAGNIDLAIDVLGYFVLGSGAPGPSGPAGPQGPAGTPGAQGMPGTNGTNGIVNVIVDSDPAANIIAAVQVNFADYTGGTLIRDLTLPAGSYEIKATTSVTAAADGPAGSFNTSVRCNLITAAPLANLDTFFQDFFQPDGGQAGYREDLEVGVVTTFAVETKVELRCYSIRSDASIIPGGVPSSKIIATQVATITQGH